MEQDMQCPKCGSEDKRKAGFVGENQRWLCKGCGCKYTRSTRHGLPASLKRQALHLYLEGMGFRAIGRALGVSNVAVLKWIRAFGAEIEALRNAGPAPHIVCADEMQGILQAKTLQPECALLCVSAPDGSAAFMWAAAPPPASSRVSEDG